MLASLLALALQAAAGAASIANQMPVVLPGVSINAGQWRVKPIRARISSEYPMQRTPVANQRYLIVDVELTNLTESSSRAFSFVLQVEQPKLPDIREPEIVLVRDRSLPDRLHPDMPEVMALVWPWPSTAAVPQEVRLTITAKTFKKADNLVGSPGWFNPKIIAHAALPLSSE